MAENNSGMQGWYKLEARDPSADGHVTGEIHLEVLFQRTEQRHFGPEDFQILKLIGKGRARQGLHLLKDLRN